MGLLGDQIADDVGNVDVGTIYDWIKVFQQVLFDEGHVIERHRVREMPSEARRWVGVGLGSRA